MIVKGNEVILSKQELQDVIIKCSAQTIVRLKLDDITFTIIQGIFACEVAKSVIKNIFGEENNE